MAEQLIDRGFDTEFSPSRIDELAQTFTPKDSLEEWIERIHNEDGAYDLKRGEFYPELLRGILTVKSLGGAAYGVDPRQVHPNFGSNGSIDTILTALALSNDLSHERGVLVATPTYFRIYNSCAARNLKLIGVPLHTHDWSFDLDRFVTAIKRENPSAVFLVSPNNPTGIGIPDKDLQEVLSATPDDTLLVLDRTLVNIKPETRSAQLLRQFPSKKLAILHSLSKYAGYSHLRMGISLYGSIELAESIAPFLPLGISLEGAIIASRYLRAGPLEAAPGIKENITSSKRILDNFCAGSHQVSVTDFDGNYCILRHDSIQSTEFAQSLESSGLIVMGGHAFPEPNSKVTRVHTAGPVEYMEKLVSKTSDFVVRWN
ncbi:MAG: aminotransferase class I/II-fold pyridoxal phosphate-dependent enzyme [Planctomycetota bacterium]